jgi:hypothetical protein
VNDFNKELERAIAGEFIVYLPEMLADGHYTSLHDEFARRMLGEALTQTVVTTAQRDTDKALWNVSKNLDAQTKGFVHIAFGSSGPGINLIVPVHLNGTRFSLFALNVGCNIQDNAQGYAEHSDAGSGSVKEFILDRLQNSNKYDELSSLAAHKLSQEVMPKPLSSVAGSYEIVGDFLAWAAYGLASGFALYGQSGALNDPEATYAVITRQWLDFTEAVTASLQS